MFQNKHVLGEHAVYCSATWRNMSKIETGGLETGKQNHVQYLLLEQKP